MLALGEAEPDRLTLRGAFRKWPTARGPRGPDAIYLHRVRVLHGAFPEINVNRCWYWCTGSVPPLDVFFNKCVQVTNVSFNMMFTNKNKCYSKKKLYTLGSISFNWKKKDLEILSWKPLRQKPKFLQYKQFPLMASSVNLSENLCLIPMDTWLWSGLTFPYIFCPLYCWGNPKCTSPCKGQLTWFRLLYSNSPKLRKTNCGRKQSTSFLARGIVFASHLCNRNYRKKPRNIYP